MTRSTTILIGLAWVGLATRVFAQCPEGWLPGDGVPAGVSGTVYAATLWDPDGPGPQPELLVVGGKFALAGDIVANSIAAWDGTAWHPLGYGLHGDVPIVYALTVYNGELIAGGIFFYAGGVNVNNVARWNGTAWQSLAGGMNDAVLALTVDPQNGDLVAGGRFTTAGGTPANRVARWNGASWSGFGAGITGSGSSTTVYALSWQANGDLIAGGQFTTAGGGPANRVARWNGVWTALGSGVNQPVFALATLPNGDLIAGGQFTTAGGGAAARIARWNGTTWFNMGAGMDQPVQALVTLSNGDLIAGGQFTTAGGVPASRIARWDGTQWSALASGMDDTVLTLIEHAGVLIVGGAFSAAGGVPASRIARWEGGSWSSLAAGDGVNGLVYAATVSAGELILGGNFTVAGGVAARRVVACNNTIWRTLGSGMTGGQAPCVYALTPHAGALVAGGDFTAADGVGASYVARWNGTAWQGLGTGTNGRVRALTEYNGELVAGGEFSTAGGAAAARIARWNGTSWSTLGTGMYHSTYAAVYAVIPFNGELIAGGEFQSAGGVPCNNIARWNGATWQPLATGTNGPVRALAVYNAQLIAAGSFTQAGGTSCSKIARWDGTSWQPLGAGMSSSDRVNALTVYNGGLIAAGMITTADGVPANRIARWNGAAWEPLGIGLSTDFYGAEGPYALAAYRGKLVAGGSFNAAGGAPAAYFARWGPIDNLGDPPSLVQQPASQVVTAGSTVHLSVSAADAQYYLWRRDGVILYDGGALSGTRSPTLTIAPADTSHAGLYDVVVENACGFVFSDGAALAVSVDDDQDGVLNVQDNCPSTSNPDQSDIDSDSMGDACDPDLDGDGVFNTHDPDPHDPHVCGDYDGDGCDDCSVGVDGFGPLPDYRPYNDGPDEDGDGICDTADQCPRTLPGLPVDSTGCTAYGFGDVDRDGDVDLADFQLVQGWYAGAGVPCVTRCARAADGDADGCVDLDDFTMLQDRWYGPEVTPPAAFGLYAPQTIFQSNASGGGDWRDPATWNGCVIPGVVRNYDAVRILPGDSVTQAGPLPCTLGLYVLDSGAEHVFAGSANMTALDVMVNGSWVAIGDDPARLVVRNAVVLHGSGGIDVRREYDCPQLCALLAGAPPPYDSLGLCPIEPCNREGPEPRWDNVSTHPNITWFAAKNTQCYLEFFITDNLGLPSGLLTQATLNGTSLSLLNWLRRGSKEEDEPDERALNHFLNPIHNSGLSQAPWVGDVMHLGAAADDWAHGGCWWSPFLCNEYGYTRPATQPGDGFLHAYFNALTDPNPVTREAWTARTFLCAGHILHLVQDMTSPEHVRNNEHYGLRPLENFMMLTFPSINSYYSIPGILPHYNGPILGRVVPRIQTFRDSFDTDEWNGVLPFTSTAHLGAAQWVNINFFSKDTIFKVFPLPTLGQTDFFEKFPPWQFDGLVPKPECTVEQPPPPPASQYLSKRGGFGNHAQIEKAASAWVRPLDPIPNQVYSTPIPPRIAVSINDPSDSGVLREYCEQLIPVAIAYSTAMLHYLFSDEMSYDFSADSGLPELDVFRLRNNSSQDVLDAEWFILRKDTREVLAAGVASVLPSRQATVVEWVPKFGWEVIVIVRARQGAETRIWVPAEEAGAWRPIG